MTYEEYFQQNPKARLVAKVMLDSLDKQASMEKSAVNWGNILDTLRGGYGKVRRGIGRIGQAGKFGDLVGKADSVIADSGKLRTLANRAKGAATYAGRQLGRELDKLPQWAQAGALAAGTSAATMGALAGANSLGKTMERKRLGKQAAVQIPPAMRVMAHIMDGNYEWIAKMAACCKKNGKCSKVDHKQMPGK